MIGKEFSGTFLEHGVMMLVMAVVCCGGTQVAVGYSMTEYGCLEFVSSPVDPDPDDDTSDVDKNLIIGLVVGIAGLIVIIVVIVVIIYAVRSRRKRHVDEGRMTYSNLQGVYADSATSTTTSSAAGTTRSFMFGPEHLSDKPEESVAAKQF